MDHFPTKKKKIQKQNRHIKLISPILLCFSISFYYVLPPSSGQTAWPSETHGTAKCHKPEDHDLNLHHGENLQVKVKGEAVPRL
jgi:hypothetical protein